MSLPPSSPSKKRKHRESVDAGNVSISPHKKAKKDRAEKKLKGKSKADREFQLVNASLLVSIPPKFALDPLSGAKEMLDSLIMKYVPALQGVLLCHSNVRFVSDAALLKNECPFLICTISFDATVWSPQVGMKLVGRMNLCSPDHISLLVHRTFNVSIPREHIPTENWAFEHGPTENDPEFGPRAVGMNGDGNVVPAAELEEQEEPHGSWVHRITDDKLGGKDGLLEFTVIGMTVANNMLSLKGSLQPDPFSPDHVPQPAVPPVHLEVEGDEEDERGEHQPPDVPGHDEESEIEEDPFAQLGQARDEAVEKQAAEQQRVEREKAQEKEEKKRRRKERKERKEKEKALAAVDGLPAPPVSTEQNEKPPKKKRKKDLKEA